MESASFESLLRTLFWIFAFYYIFKFLMKLLLPVVVKKVVEKAAQGFQEQQKQYSNKSKSDGDIIIDDSQAKKSQEKNKVGDYIDFEEIK